jgi:DNA-binding SARP family transcriptional activator
VDSRPSYELTLPGRRVFLHLLGGPFITFNTQRLDPPEGSKRLLALLALHGTRIERHRAAGQLWPDVDHRRADGNLRTALWRLHGAGLNLIESDSQALTLHAGLGVDVHLVQAWTNRVITGRTCGDDLTLAPWIEEALCILPGWYDDWVILERERLRQSLLQALEALSRRLYQAGRFAEAVEAALIAAAADPFRESAQQVLIEAHLAEGNLVEAHRARDAYRSLLRRELGAPLSPLMSSLISGSYVARPADLALVR